MESRPGQRTLIAALIGVVLAGAIAAAVAFAYPAPKNTESELRSLAAQQKQLDDARAAAGGSLSPSHEAIYKKVAGEIAEKQKALTGGRNSWVLASGAILLACAVLLLGASFVGALSGSISGGLLLGGVLLALYSAGWSIVRTGPPARFAIAAAAVVIALAATYLTYRPRAGSAPVAEADASESSRQSS